MGRGRWSEPSAPRWLPPVTTPPVSPNIGDEGKKKLALLREYAERHIWPEIIPEITKLLRQER